MNNTQNTPSSSAKRAQSVSPTRNAQQSRASRTLPDRQAKRHINSYADNTPRLTRTPKGKLIKNPELDVLDTQTSSKKLKDTVNTDDDVAINDISTAETPEDDIPTTKETLKDSLHAPKPPHSSSSSSVIDP